MIRKLLNYFLFLYRYICICRGNKTTYLRSLGATIGERCDIFTSVRNFGSEPWLIEIGNKVTLTAGTLLITHDGASRLFRDSMPGMSRFGNRFGTIRILDNSFVGVNVIILPGITIGPNSIVGSGSVVTKDVPPNSVVAGNPARTICTVDEYITSYKKKMIPIAAANRGELRVELTQKLWGQSR
ncbi:MAG TPA: acyltransferase [Geomonas sp.]|nr:acyltransferase [Geomonas sp.]